MYSVLGHPHLVELLTRAARRDFRSTGEACSTPYRWLHDLDATRPCYFRISGWLITPVRIVPGGSIVDCITHLGRE